MGLDALTGEGKLVVSRISEKSYFGKDILHIALFNKNDDQTVYNMIYQDGPRGNVMMKRFTVGGVTRDKVYELTRGNEKSKVLYLSISDPKNVINEALRVAQVEARARVCVVSKLARVFGSRLGSV